MRRLLTLFVGLLLLAALTYYWTTRRGPAIEAQVRTCVENALEQIDAGGVDVAVDGRDVTLTGTVPSDVFMRQAAIVAGEDCGARVVTNSLQVVQLPPYETQLCIDANVVQIRGNVADAAGRDRVLAVARDRYPTDLDAELVIRTDAPDGHGSVLDAALIDLTQLDSGCISLTDGTLSVSGTIRSAAARNRLVETLDAASAQRFQTSYDVSVTQKSERTQQCEAFFAQLFQTGESVLFEGNSTEIHSDGRRLLDSVVTRLERCSGQHVTVAVHTDSTGDVGHNRDFSQQRAQAIVDYLIDRGVEPARLTAAGFGEWQPRASNDTDAGRASNRRIELRLSEGY